MRKECSLSDFVASPAQNTVNLQLKWSIPKKAAMWDTFENSTSDCKNALKLQRECRFRDAKHAVTSSAVVQNWPETAARVEFPCR